MLGGMAVNSVMLPLGTPLPAFELPDPTGTVHRTADHAEAPGVLVAFLCNHCPYVKHVAPALGRLAKQWQGDGLAVLGVNSNDAAAYPEDSPDQMLAFARAHDWTFPYLVDEAQEVGRTYQAACTPDFFLFGRDGTLAYRGRLDASRPNSGVPVTGDDLDAAIRAVLAGEPAPADQFPSIGCSIKWKPGNEPA
jgi:peroxiredoxin